MSKLNLYQCLAVAKPHYEDVFCLGQHVLIDTGQLPDEGRGRARAAGARDAIAAADARRASQRLPSPRRRRGDKHSRLRPPPAPLRGGGCCVYLRRTLRSQGLTDAARPRAAVSF